MAYTTSQAIETLNEYMDCDEAIKQYIDGTKKRGFILSLKTGEQIVIFVYPLVHKQDNTKNYFDTRDSGAYERGVAWRYALEHGLKYYCFGLNSSVHKYENYIFSLECGEETIEKISGTKNGQRNGPGNQIIIPNNYTPALPFDRIINKLGIYIAVVHKDKIYDYISMYDNRPYLKTNVDEVTSESTDINEYERAARYLQSYVSETGFDIPTKNNEIETVLDEFNARFSPDILLSLSDDELLGYLFYTDGENLDSLCYWLEMDTDCRKNFGSIVGGSAYKFGLFQKQKTGEWMTGSPQKPQVLTEEAALEQGTNIRNALVKAAEIVKNASLDSITDYEQLDSELWEKIGAPYCNWGWFHKYLSMVCPDKLSCFHSSDWQRHILYALKIKPSDRYFVRSGQLAMVENYANWYYGEFKDVLCERFGSNIIQFVRIGTSDNTRNYAAEWNRKSVVGIGWRDIGSLENYVAGEVLDKASISRVLKEKYGYAENVASRKAGELIRFYKTDSNTVMVAMDGERLLAFIDGIGNYFYDSAYAMANMKPGTWHRNFASDEQLPVKTEGKLTSCYTLTNEENLMFLYERYYYGNEEIIDDMDEIEFDNPEERNKRNFRVWMEMQVKPEGDTDSGQPYTENAINQYVSNILNTKLFSDEEHSVFFTDSVVEVQNCIVKLEMSERKNNTQISAIKKYLMYLMALQEVNMPLVYNTSLETEYERNRIVFGAPGTGKSFNLKRDCESCLKGTTGSYERVTFHPDYTYSQFVGTYKPVSDGTVIRYEFVPGPFMRVYVEALKSARSSNPQPHILIIEEINRAKVAAVFGDVFQLLDRDEDGVSEYEIQTSEDIRKYLASELECNIDKCKKIKIPNNMFIWATMNSADQGVFPMDTAFKRRWNFEYLGINENQDKIKGRVSVGSSVTQEIEWNVLRRAINEKLAKEYKVNEDKLKEGNETERAAMLVEVLKQNFGGLAEAMANTSEGKIVQIKNAWGDMQEVIGGKLYPVVTTFFGYVASAMPSVQNAVVSAIDAVSVPLSWIKNNVLPPLITAFQNVWNYGVSAFNNIKTAVMENSGSFGSVTSVLGGVKNALFNAFDFCKPALNWIKDTGLPLVVNALAGVVQKATDVYNFFVNNWGWIAPIISGIVGAIVTFRIAVFAINTAMNAWAIVQGICTAAQWAWNAAMTANPVGIIIVAIGALIAIGVALWMNWDSVCAWCKQAFQAVGDFFVSVGTSIGSFFVGLWTEIKDTAVGVWNGITEFLSSAWNTISSAAVSVFTGIGNAIKNVWNGIVGAIKGAINSIISAINSMIRGAVSGVNGLINGINSVTGAVGIPAIPTFTAPQIPMLANGGMIRTAGTVIVGEKGPEMLSLPSGAKVTPIDKSRRSENKFYINIYADGKSADEIVDELIPKLKLVLANL